MDPINYTTDVQTPFQSALQGYQAGAAIRDDQLKQQQMLVVQQQQQRQAEMLQSLISNPNASAKDYANATIAMPGLKDNFKQAFEMRNAEQQQTTLRDLGQYYAAVTSGRPDIAVAQMKRRADAMEAAGVPKQEVMALRAQAQVIEAHPEFARATMGMLLSSVPGGDKFLTAAAAAGTEQRAVEQAPADLAKKNAEAGIKGVEAANAQTKTALENANAAEDIESKQAQRQIAALNTQISQANSETQRGQLILERDKLQQIQDEKKRSAGTAAQDQIDKLQSSISLVDSIMKHPGLEAIGFNRPGMPGLGGVGTATGKLAGLLPGTDRKDLQGLVDTLSSQQFLTSIQQMQGMGALSDAEGKKIGAAVASLDLDQSPKAFKNALGVVRTTLEKAQAKALASGKLPTSGGAFLMKHPTFGNITDGDVNRLLTANPGSTREQVLQYLQSTGGKSSGGATGGF